MQGVELTFAQQSEAFARSVLLGVFIAVFYGILKLIRFTFSFKTKGTVVCDVLFMLVWSLAVFYFSLAYLSGYIRLYIILGTFAGFLLYRMLLGRLFCRIYTPLIVLFRVLLNKICYILKIITKKLLKFAYRIMYNIFSKKDTLLKNGKNNKKRKNNEYEKRKKYEESIDQKGGGVKAKGRKAKRSRRGGGA